MGNDYINRATTPFHTRTHQFDYDAHIQLSNNWFVSIHLNTPRFLMCLYMNLSHSVKLGSVTAVLVRSRELNSVNDYEHCLLCLE